MYSSSVMQRWAVALALGVVGAVAVMPSAARTSAATCARVATPNVGGGDNALLGVSATSTGNAWAVGYRYSPVGTQRATLIEHWNGRGWTVQASPSPGGYDELADVAATSPGNAWAVGYYSSAYPPQPDRPLLEHWNGNSWQVQAGPSLGVGELYGVAATSPRNAWVVGSDVNGVVIEGWNGRVWTLQASSQLGIGALLSVAATSPRNAWAVGYGDAGAQTLIEHWNGRRWKAQRSPKPPVAPGGIGAGPEQGVQLSAVAAASPRNVWAVGYTSYAIDGSGDEQAESMIEHWNGRAWRRQASPDTSGTTVLSGVAATSSHDAWAVGQPFGLGQAAIEHWNGRAWQLRPSPNGELFGVAATSSRDAWAVGTDGTGTLAVHCS